MPVRALIICLVALIANGAALADGKVPPERAIELQRLVRHDCGSCHGMTLNGGLGPDLRAERLSSVPVEDIASIILDGMPNTAMPAWGSLLSKAEAKWIAEYILKGEPQ